MKKANNSTATFLSSILILFLVVLVVGFFAFRTDNFTTGIKSFYVSCNGKDIFGDKEDFNVIVNKEYKFDIHSETDFLSNSEKKYYVQVVPNENCTFDFTLDNVKKSFTDFESLSKFFIITSYEDYFTFKAIGTELEYMIKSICNTENVMDCPTLIDSGKPYLRLVVHNGKGEIININFNVRSE